MAETKTFRTYSISKVGVSPEQNLQFFKQKLVSQFSKVKMQDKEDVIIAIVSFYCLL